MARRILVVEDDLLNRMFYCATLEQAGYAVTAVGDGALVLQEVARVSPDLIIMDINLPHVSGLVLTERLKSQAAYRDLPILAITAYVGRGGGGADSRGRGGRLSFQAGHDLGAAGDDRRAAARRLTQAPASSRAANRPARLPPNRGRNTAAAGRRARAAGPVRSADGRARRPARGSMRPWRCTSRPIASAR